MEINNILLLSGGIDSTILLAQLVDQNKNVTPLIFDYGQSLIKEVNIARSNAQEYGLLPITIKIPLAWLPENHALLNNEELPLDRTLKEIRESGTPASYVPFRNGIFLACAVAYGESAGITQIFCGGNGLSSGNYWDDTAKFAALFTLAADSGTAPEYKPIISMPYAHIAKKEIVSIGDELGVDYTLTWSCYKNGPVHCGRCDSCIQRCHALGGNLKDKIAPFPQKERNL